MSAPRVLSKAALPKVRASRGSRLNIVSDYICDDILSYIGPSLAKHKGCDILDGSPGVGLWSSKIHDFLQPRRHVLIESDDAYMPFLKPYLDAPGSTYVHAPFDGSRLEGFAQALAEGYLPDQQALSKDDPRINQPNNTLLVLANLTKIQVKSARTSSLYKRHTMRAITSAAWTHSLFHKYGLIRMLFWVDDSVKDSTITKTLQVDAYNLGFNWTVDANIVAETSPDRFPRNSPDCHGLDLDFASAVETARRMQLSGMKLPSHRSWDLHTKALEMSTQIQQSETDEGLHLLAPVSTYTESHVGTELEELESAFASGRFGRFRGQSTNSGSLQPERIDPRFIRMLYLRKMRDAKQPDVGSATGTKKQRGRKANKNLVALRQLTRKMFDTDVQLGRGEPSSEEYLAAVKSMDEMAEELKRIENSMSHVLYRTARLAVDHRIAFYMDPPILMWDRRQYEPLLIKENELQPKSTGALLDVLPKPPPRAVSVEDLTYWKRFVEQLLKRQTAPIKKALEQTASGSSEVVLEAAKSLRDTKRGGSIKPELLCTRCLRPDMLDDVVQAYRSWLFRPDDLEKAFTEDNLDWDDLIFTLRDQDL